MSVPVPVGKNPLFAPPIDRCPEIEPDSESEEDELILIEEEPKPKVKNELMKFEQIVQNPTIETLKQLLLFGVDTTIQKAKHRAWPALTGRQEDQLRWTYEGLLRAVPLVRGLDRQDDL